VNLPSTGNKLEFHKLFRALGADASIADSKKLPSGLGLFGNLHYVTG